MKYVAFLDILGFKNTLKTLGQERSIEYIENYSRIVYQVFSRYNRNEERQNTEKKINGFVVGRNSILIRGAIAKGEFNKIPAVELKNLQKQLIVGDAYVKAYGMEDSFKSIGVRLSDEVYQDVENALINCDIVEESVENDKYYVLRYMNIDYLLKTEGVFHKFIFAAKKSGWLPHYYNSLYIVMKGVTNTRKVDKLFDVILTEVSGGSPSENWRDVDKFIKNSFNSGVFSTYQTRFLTYLRNHLQISNEHD